MYLRRADRNDKKVNEYKEGCEANIVSILYKNPGSYIKRLINPYKQNAVSNVTPIAIKRLIKNELCRF